MAAKTKRNPVAIKASESVVARMVASMLGVPPRDVLQEVLEEAAEARSDLDLSVPIDFYPWLADVPSQVMSNSTGPLVEHIASFEDGVWFVVKDSVRAGAAGIWLVAANVEPWVLGADLPWRGLFNNFPSGDGWVTVTAVQLESCLRQQ